MAKSKNGALKAGNNQGKDQDPMKVFLRNLIFCNPQLSVVQANEALQKTGKHGEVTSRLLNGVKSGIVRTFGVTSEKLPCPKKNQTPNLSALLRLYVKKRPHVSTAEAQADFAAMGLSVNSVSLSTAKKSLGHHKPQRRKASLLRAEDHDEEPKGPRARKMTGRGRKPGKRKMKLSEMTAETREEQAKAWEDAETALDQLSKMAQDVGESKLAQSLRTSRRLVSAKIVQLVT